MTVSVLNCHIFFSWFCSRLSYHQYHQKKSMYHFFSFCADKHRKKENEDFLLVDWLLLAGHERQQSNTYFRQTYFKRF